MAWIYLALAIAFEVAGTSVLPATDGMRRPALTALVLGCYGLSFFLLAQAVKEVPVSICYAIWAGVGVAAIALIGALTGHSLNAAAAVGIGLILFGTVMVNLAGAGH